MNESFGKGVGACLLATLVLFPAAAAAVPGPPDRRGYVRTVEEFEYAPGRPGMTTATYAHRSYSPRKPTALILALHYGGRVTPDTGSEFAELLVLPGLGELKAVILAPSCPGRGWTDPVSEEALLRLVEAARKKFAIDGRRVAVTGFSMGAIGTYRMAARHPEVFTAAIAVSGLPDPEDIETMGGIPLYIIQSDGDEIFPIDEAGRTFEKLRANHPGLKIEIVSGLSHYRTAAFVPALQRAASWLKKVWKNP